MTLENFVLLFVIVVDAMIIGLCARLDRLANKAERRRQFVEKLNFKTCLIVLVLMYFSGYELYQWYETNQLYYGGRSVRDGMEVPLAAHPWAFAFLGILYSMMFIGCGFSILLVAVEVFKQPREE